jgi:hypothetical protein
LITAAIAPQQVAAPTIIAMPRHRFDSPTADSGSDKNWQLGNWAIWQLGFGPNPLFAELPNRLIAP